jgi:hypothetical protein
MKTDLEKAQDAVEAWECKLAVATREKSSVDRKVRSAATAAIGDNKVRMSLAGLNKESEAAQRMVRTIERDLAEAKKRLGQVQNSLALQRANSAAMANAHLPPGQRLFVVVGPDQRQHGHRHRTPEALSATLQPGYKVCFEVFGSAADGTGGTVASVGGTDVPSFLAGILRASGPELLAWLQSHGVVFSNTEAGA